MQYGIGLVGQLPPARAQQADGLRDRPVVEPSGTAERDKLLTSTASRLTTELCASAVIVHLYEPQARALIATVVSVTPLGIGSVERVQVDDNSYASSVAFQTGKMATAHSVQELGSHPELAVFAPWPFTVTSLPLLSPTRRFGTLAVYWPQMFRKLSLGERRHLEKIAADTGRELDLLADRGISMAPFSVPHVVTPKPTTRAWTSLLGAAPGGTAQDAESEQDTRTTPLIYHLHKLANALISADNTQEAVDLTLERVTKGFHANAMAISLVEGDRLRVVGSVGCSREFLRRLHGQPLGKSSLESDAITQKRQIIESPPTGEWPAATASEIGTAAKALVGEVQLVDEDERTPGPTPGMRASRVWAVLPLLAGGHAVGIRPDQPLRRPDRGGDRGCPRPQHLRRGRDGQLRSAVRAYAAEGHDPSTVLSRTNRLLVELDTDRFATCLCLWLDPSTGQVETVTAGHNPPDRPHAGWRLPRP
ncbi:MAG: SpoIIE family protein phosphatase [Streptomycetaceae bacterium]|nr:SpoIIE family protein phosphatase [Streptomycetaceae bacterium]